MIVFDQAHYPAIVTGLEKLGCRGFTAWNEVQGRGSYNGDPHYGSHAWPSLSSAIITVVEDEKAPSVMVFLKGLDEESPRLGLRAFMWTIDAMI